MASWSKQWIHTRNPCIRASALQTSMSWLCSSPARHYALRSVTTPQGSGTTGGETAASRGKQHAAVLCRWRDPVPGDHRVETSYSYSGRTVKLPMATCWDRGISSHTCGVNRPLFSVGWTCPVHGRGRLL